MDDLEEIRKRKLKEIENRFGGKSMTEIIDKPIEVIDSTFDEMVKKHGLIVIDCWAEWCGPCRMVGPVIDELAKDHAGKVVFGKLNVDNNREISMKHQIMSIPTLLVFKNGELVDRIVGALPKSQLDARIKQFL